MSRHCHCVVTIAMVPSLSLLLPLGIIPRIAHSLSLLSPLRHPLHCMRLAALPVDCCPFSDFFCSPCNIHCCCRCHQCSGDSSQFATTAQLPLPVCFIFMAVPMHCSCFGFCLAMPQGLLLMPVDCCLSKQQKLIFLGCSNAPAATITCVAATATTNSEP